MIDNKDGSPIIFHMDLIHGGALNKSKNCRISLEFEFSIIYQKNISLLEKIKNIKKCL